MKFSTALISAVLGCLGLFVFASLPGEPSKATRRFLVEELAPVADLINEQRSPSYGFGADGKPASIFDVFLGKGGADSDFASCISRDGPSLASAGLKFFPLNNHKSVAGVASCFIGANRPSLCQEAGRTKLAAMMEIYLSTKQRELKRLSEGFDGQSGLTSEQADADDPERRTWDGADDRAIFAKLKRLAADGYISLDDFGWFPRAEIREALSDVAAERAPCAVAMSSAQ
jgi:hypothetical protein